jgi:hypothetical protein
MTEAIDKLKQLRRGTRPDSLSWNALRDEGRRVTIVIDASIALAWCFEDEASPETDALVERIREEGAIVPSLGSWN